MSYFLHLVVYLNLYVIIAISLNIIVGYCGLFTLAHAGYFAVGAYAYAILTVQSGLGFFSSLAAAMLMGIAGSLAVSLPTWRFRGDYFVLVSLAVQMLILSGLRNWFDPTSPVGTWANLTNGPFGIAGVPGFAGWGPIQAGPFAMPVVSSAIAIFVVVFCAILLRSPWGRLLKSTRDDELVTRGLGKNVRRAKVEAFALSCGLVSLAGGLYAAYASYVHPSNASLDESILMLSMVLVGGVGNVVGPIVGAVVLLLLPEALRLIELPGAIASNVRLLIYGLLLLLVAHYRPQGIAGEYRVR